MRVLIGSLCVFCSALGTAAGLRAGASTEPRAVIRKAIQALGGEEKLTRYKASVTKGKCKFYGNGRAIDCDAEWSMQLPRQIKASYVMQMGGKTLKRIEVINGDKGWIMMGDKTTPLPAEQLAEIAEGGKPVTRPRCYRSRIPTISFPLWERAVSAIG